MAPDLDRRTQLLRGALDTCLLALLARNPTHAYDLVVQLERHGLPDISYGTVYPVMTRLRSQGLVRDETRSSDSGPPRKVFHVTEEGHRTLRAWSEQWTETTTTITALLRTTGAVPALEPEEPVRVHA